MSAPRSLKLDIPSGVVKTRSGEGAEGRYSSANNIRFVNGRPQKRAGFVKRNSTPVSGIGRGMGAWNTLTGKEAILLGTTQSLYGSVDSAEFTDIMPLVHGVYVSDKVSTTAGSGRLALNVTSVNHKSGTSSLVGSVNLTNPFTTTNGSPLVTVAVTAHGRVVGDRVQFSGASASGGITVDGFYVVQSVTNANEFVVRHSSNASSAATGGGSVVYRYNYWNVGSAVRLYGSALKGIVGGLPTHGEFVVIGTNTALSQPDEIYLYPSSPSATLTNPFTTTSGSATVTVAHNSHGKATGDIIAFEVATDVAGLVLYGEYSITFITPSSYTITAAATATSAVSNAGGTVRYRWGTKAGATEGNAGGKLYLNVRSHLGSYGNMAGMVTSVTTQSGVNTVEINFLFGVPDGLLAGSYVTISDSSAVNGITLNGRYAVSNVTGNSATVTHSNPANATSTGQPSAWFEFSIVSGLNQDSSTSVEAGYWSIDNAGEDGIACNLGGAVYYWDSSATARPEAIDNAPRNNRYAFLTDERMLHVLGANGDPMAIGWSDQDDFDNWTVSSTTTANTSRRVTDGSKLMAGTRYGQGVNLIWTDTRLYVHTYTGGPFVYRTKEDVPDSGIIGPHAFVVTPKGVFWIGQSALKWWNGYTQDIPTQGDVQDWIFRQINRAQASKCWAHYDRMSASVDFYFVVGSNLEPTVRLTLNLDDLRWCDGTETRTTGASLNSGKQTPLRMGTNGFLYKHEEGLDADGAAAATSLTLAPLEAAKGAWVEATGIDPDMKRQTGNVQVTITTYDRYPGSPEDTETQAIEPASEMVDYRVSGRHFGLEWSQTVLGGDFAIDVPQIELRAPQARRR